MTFADVLWGTIAPILGNLCSLILFVAPWKSIAQIKAAQDVGVVNGVPFIFMLFQCILWVAYAFFISELAIVPVNAVGALFALYYTLVFYGALKDQAVRFRIELGAAIVILVPSIMATVCFFWINDSDTKKLVFGITCNIVCVIFMGSPLSSVASVIRLKDSASLTWPITIAVIANGGVWMVYGWHLDNIFILAPNAAGATMGVLQLLLKLVYPAIPTVVDDKTALLNPA